MAVDYYKKAQIYLTKCTHPDFDYLRYVGLDTKCEEAYKGSGVALKWFMNKLGRSYFKKEILETCSGTMRDVCRVEQKHILSHNAVKDPNYLNMNGGIKKELDEECVVDLEYNIHPTDPIAQKFINDTVKSLNGSIRFFNHSRQQLARRVVSMVTYGYLKYGQESFNYNRFSYYGSCTDGDLQNILSVMANLNILDSGFSQITITEDFIEGIPQELIYTDFTIKNTQ